MNGVLAYYKHLNGFKKGEILSLAMNCYSHVITGTKTFKEWAQAIKDNYSLDDPRNLVIYTAVNETEGTINSVRHGDQIYMRYKKS